MIQIWSRTVESLSFAIPWRYFKDAASNPCQELTAYPSVIRDQIRDTFIENLRSLESVPGPHSSTRLRPAATTSCGKLSHASASDDPQATRAKTFQSSFFAAPSRFSSLFFLSPLFLSLLETTPLRLSAVKLSRASEFYRIRELIRSPLPRYDSFAP